MYLCLSWWASLVAQLVKIHLQCRRPWFDSWVGKIPWRRIGYPLQYSWSSLVAQTVKNLFAMQETWVPSLGWVGGGPNWRRACQRTPVFFPGESLRGVWPPVVPRVAQSWIWLSDLAHAHTRLSWIVNYTSFVLKLNSVLLYKLSSKNLSC